MTKLQTILVTGSTGQLGLSIKTIASDYPDYDFVFANRQQLDLSNKTNIADFFEHQTFHVIINCVAYTSVDAAESEPELANQINHIAVQQLADIAKQKNTKLIHISTDYVFNGKQYRPYLDTDSVEPQGVYGQTKLSGEQAIKNTLKNNAIIIRTSWVYSEYGNNFVKTMLKLGQERDSLNVIFDQVGTPTYAKDLAKAIMSIVQSQEFHKVGFTTNIVHFTNEGVCSWYDFAKTIFEVANIQCHVNAIETKDYPAPAKRPHNSRLDTCLLRSNFGLTLPAWQQGVTCMLDEIKKQR